MLAKVRTTGRRHDGPAMNVRRLVRSQLLVPGNLRSPATSDGLPT